MACYSSSAKEGVDLTATTIFGNSMLNLINMGSDSRTMETIYWQSRQSFPDNKKSNKRRKPVRPNRPILDQHNYYNTGESRQFREFSTILTREW